MAIVFIVFVYIYIVVGIVCGAVFHETNENTPVGHWLFMQSVVVYMLWPVFVPIMYRRCRSFLFRSTESDEPNS